MGWDENRGEHPAAVGRGFSSTLGAGPRIGGRYGGDQDLAPKPGRRKDYRSGGTENPRLRIVAIKRSDRQLEMIPSPETQIESDDLLVVIGEPDSLKRLASA